MRGDRSARARDPGGGAGVDERTPLLSPGPSGPSSLRTSAAASSSPTTSTTPMPEDSKSKDAAEVVVTEAQAAPETVGEGPTVTKWEEWVSRSAFPLLSSSSLLSHPAVSSSPLTPLLTPLSPYPYHTDTRPTTSTTTATAVRARTATRTSSSRPSPPPPPTTP